MEDNIIKELINKEDANDKKIDKNSLNSFWNSLIKAIFLLIFPFIFPIIANFLIYFNILDNIAQLGYYINIFKYFYILIIVEIVLLYYNESDVNFFAFISDFINNINVDAEKGDTRVHISIKNETKKMSNDLKEQTKSLLDNKNLLEENQHLCNDCKNEIIAERESLRYFAAYQITDEYVQNLLILIKNNGKISVKAFRDGIEKYFEKKYHYINKNKKQKIILRKIDNLLYNLKYINIIEFTEDNRDIILTQNGEEFVKGLYESEVG